MRVGVDTHMIGHRETGNETYVLGLLYGLERLGFSVDAYVTQPRTDNFHRQHRLLPDTSPVRVPITNPFVAFRDCLDLWHATYVLPPWLPCPGVVTVHDLTYTLFPEWFSPRVRHMLEALVPRALASAGHVITISENSKRDIVNRYGVNPDRITVTYLAPRPRPQLTEPLPACDDFILYVGNASPRKNLKVVIEAVSRLHRNGDRVRLVVAGNVGNGEENRLAAQLDLGPVVEFRGYVSDAQVAALYRSCTALVHPARYEGFGLTLVEALAAGTPVIAARSSSVPEVLGDAGIYVNKSTPDAWAQTLHDVLTNRPLRATLSERGRARARLFSWEKTARQTLSIYERVLQRPTGIF